MHQSTKIDPNKNSLVRLQRNLLILTFILKYTLLSFGYLILSWRVGVCISASVQKIPGLMLGKTQAHRSVVCCRANTHIHTCGQFRIANEPNPTDCIWTLGGNHNT